MTTENRRKTLVAAAGLALFIGLAVGKAQGVPITFQFAGVIDSVDDPDNVLNGAVLPGNLFSGNYTFESTTPDALPGDATIGDYGPPGPEIGMVIDTLHLAISADNSGITVQTITLSSSQSDYYKVSAARPFQVETLRIIEIGLSFIDEQGTVFSNDSLPLVPPDLSVFETRQLRVQGEQPGSPEFFIFGTVTTLTPEPGGLTFLLVGLALMSRRRHD